MSDSWEIARNRSTKYINRKKIGRGAFGVVYVAQTRDTGEQVAIKEIYTTGDNLIQKEVNILEKLNHKRIIKFHEWIDFEIVMEYATKGNLSEKLKSENIFSEEKTHFYAKQILEGLIYLHSNHVIHRDLKPGNILLNKDENVKLCDFGVSRLLKTNENANSFKGTLQYMAPEVLQEDKYTSKADVWSLGIIAIEMINGFVPRNNMKHYQILREMFEKNVLIEYELPAYSSTNFKEFVKCSLSVEIQRATSQELNQTKWISESTEACTNDIDRTKKCQYRIELTNITNGSHVDDDSIELSNISNAIYVDDVYPSTRWQLRNITILFTCLVLSFLLLVSCTIVVFSFPPICEELSETDYFANFKKFLETLQMVEETFERSNVDSIDMPKSFVVDINMDHLRVLIMYTGAHCQEVKYGTCLMLLQGCTETAINNYVPETDDLEIYQKLYTLLHNMDFRKFNATPRMSLLMHRLYFSLNKYDQDRKKIVTFLRIKIIYNIGIFYNHNNMTSECKQMMMIVLETLNKYKENLYTAVFKMLVYHELATCSEKVGDKHEWLDYLKRFKELCVVWYEKHVCLENFDYKQLSDGLDQIKLF